MLDLAITSYIWLWKHIAIFFGGLRLQHLQAMESLCPRSAMNQTNHESRPGDSCPTILLVPELALACRKRMGLLFPELINYHNITIIAIISHRTHLELSVWASVCIFQGKWLCNITTKKTNKYRRSSPIVYQNTATQQDDSKSRLPKNPPEKDSSSKPFYPRVK